MKKLLIFSVLIANQLQANQNTLHPFVLTWSQTMAGMIDASAFYLGFYGDKTLCFWKRDAEMLGDCTKMCADVHKQSAKQDIRYLAISRISSNSEHLGNYISAQNLPHEKDCVMIDTGREGSLMTRFFPNAIPQLIISLTDKIPMTFQLLVHLNPHVTRITSSQLTGSFFNLLQNPEGTFPLRSSAIINYNSTPPYNEIHKENRYQIENSYVSPKLYKLYIEALYEEINKPSTQKRLKKRMEFWSKIREKMDSGHEEEVIEIAKFYCNPDDPLSLALVRDMYEILKLANFEVIFPNLNKKTLTTKMEKLFEEKKIFQDLGGYFQTYIEGFVPLDKINDLSADEIAERILATKDSSNFYHDLFRFYLSVPYFQKNKIIQDNFFHGIGSVIGKLIADNDQFAEQLYQLIFRQEKDITTSRFSTISAIAQALIDGNNPTKLREFENDLMDHHARTSLDGICAQSAVSKNTNLFDF
jgi:hypothetical protein